MARSAQQQIKDKTGMRVKLVIPAADELWLPRQMLQVIAGAVGMDTACYQMKSRARDIAELRFIGALFMRYNFPGVTLQQIAACFGGQDHTSIINGIARANDMIYTGDERFMVKYNAALKAVTQWLGKEA